ncbi:hypothetical protein K402DRAFT_297469, partial [Aulographum hederae CBS 113979]
VDLARVFSTCVESFGLIHPSKEWNKQQHLLITLLGIQQGRLLIWGDVLGITDSSPARDTRLDQPIFREPIEERLQTITFRLSRETKAVALSKYGLKPPKRFTSEYERALDINRLGAFRTRFWAMTPHDSWKDRRGVGVTVTQTHWTIADNTKFSDYVAAVRTDVDDLISLMGVQDEQIDRAMKHDIKALGWHPVFDKGKAARDMTSLRLIRDACVQAYPAYSAETKGALKYLEEEWSDNYASMRASRRQSEATPTVPKGSMKVPEKKGTGNAKADATPLKPRKQGFLASLRQLSFGKTKNSTPRSGNEKTSTANSKTLTATPSTTDPERSKSASEAKPDNEDGEALMPQRSMSMTAVPTGR